MSLLLSPQSLWQQSKRHITSQHLTVAPAYSPAHCQVPGERREHRNICLIALSLSHVTQQSAPPEPFAWLGFGIVLSTAEQLICLLSFYSETYEKTQIV